MDKILIIEKLRKLRAMKLVPLINYIKKNKIDLVFTKHLINIYYNKSDGVWEAKEKILGGMLDDEAIKNETGTYYSISNSPDEIDNVDDIIENDKSIAPSIFKDKKEQNVFNNLVTIFV